MTNRTGWPEPDRFLAQNSKPWGGDPWGHGGLTVGGAGCPGAALSTALRLAGIDPDSTPGTVARKALSAVPLVFDPGSSAAYLPRLATLVGFNATGEWRAPATSVDDARALILAAIESGGFAWVNVDKTADGKGDHWVLAYAFDDEVIHYADSATGKRGELDRASLTGPSVWAGKPKQYRAVRGYTLHVRR